MRISKALIFFASLPAFYGAFAARKSKGDDDVQVKIMRRVAADRYQETNDFKLKEEQGTRVCGNATVPDHAVNLPWLKDLRKPAGSAPGMKEPPRGCRSVLKWDERHFCLDRMRRKSKILDLVRRCSEF